MSRAGCRAVARAVALVALAVGVAGGTLAPLPAHAQAFETPPPPAAPRPLRIEAPAEQTLPNGLRVIVAERHGLPLVSAQLMVLAGAEADPPQAAGLASLTAGLLTRGTRRLSAPALARAAEALGGTLDSAAGWHRSSVAMTVTTPQLDAALGLIADVARNPAFQQPEIDRLRAETLDEMKVAYSRPGTVAALTATRMLFGSGAYGQPSAGTPASLPRLRRSDIVQLHAVHYRPDNAVLVLAGDITLAQALPLAQQHFGSWARPAKPLPDASPAVGTASTVPLTLIDMPGAGQAGVALALPLPDSRSADEPAGAVANAVLGGGYSSRLNQEIRIKRGLSYGASSTVDLRSQAGLLRAQVQTKNESAAEVVGLLQAEVDRMAAAAVPADELAARKATLIGGFSRSVETTASLGAAIATLVAAGRSPAELAGRIDVLQAVSAEQVQAYARTRLGSAQRRLAVAGDAQQFEAALKALVPNAVTVKESALDLGRPAP